MPVFDWLRTDLARIIEEDGSNSLYFDENDLGNMGPLEIVKKTAENSNGFSLPGWEPERLAELSNTLKKYEGMEGEKLLENYRYFLNGIIPVCEETGIEVYKRQQKDRNHGTCANSGKEIRHGHIWSEKA